MTTRKTTNGYKVRIILDDWYWDFYEYSGIQVTFKNISRDYDFWKIAQLELEDWEIDYLLGNIDKQTILDEDVFKTEDDFTELDKMKNDFQVVWLSFGEHSNVYIWFGNDWIMLANKEDTMEDIEKYIDMLNARFNWRIYRVDIYEPIEYTTTEPNHDKIIYRDFVDGCGGYRDHKQAIEELPEFVWKIIDETETDRDEFIEFVR